MERLEKGEQCPNCGGIVPGLMLVCEGKKYRFTCIEIKDEKGEVTAKTNYEQLAKYISAGKESHFRIPKEKA